LFNDLLISKISYNDHILQVKQSSTDIFKIEQSLNYPYVFKGLQKDIAIATLNKVLKGFL